MSVQRFAFGYWEKRRLLFLLGIGGGAYLGWSVLVGLNSGLDSFPVPRVSDSFVYIQLIAAFVVANMGYSMCYVFEFFFGGVIDARPKVAISRPLLFCGMCLLGAFSSFAVSGRIAHVSALQMAVFPEEYERVHRAEEADQKAAQPGATDNLGYA